MVNYDAPKIQDSGQDVTAPDGSFRAAFMHGSATYTPAVQLGMRNFTKLKIASGGDPVEVKDGNSHIEGVRIVVQRDHLTIAGTTVDGDGNPLGDVHINAYRSDSENSGVFNQWMDHPSATSSGDGRFAIDDLDSGSFVLQARAGDGAESIVRGIQSRQQERPFEAGARPAASTARSSASARRRACARSGSSPARSSRRSTPPSRAPPSTSAGSTRAPTKSWPTAPTPTRRWSRSPPDRSRR